MKVFSLNHSDYQGGAAKAAHRIMEATRGRGVDNYLYVNRSKLDDQSVLGPGSIIQKAYATMASKVGALISKGVGQANGGGRYLSSSVMPSFWPKFLNQSACDLVHLHWVNGEMLSISDIANIKKPLVWTLHDMWAFSGAEHYPDSEEWKSGYLSRGEKFNFDAWVWRRKLKHWRQPIQLVSPSNWLKNCIQSSRLMGDWNVEVIGNPIDVEMWCPEGMNQAREALGIPLGDDVILFGAVNGGRDLRKGFDLLIQAIQYLKSSNRWSNIRLIIFGENKPEIEVNYGFPTHYFGHIANEGMLRTLYSASDLFIAPSRQEVFGQTATEAHACGCPVLAFDGTGLSDIIEHLKTGYLAQPFLVSSLVEGIEWIFSEKKRSNLVSQRLAARESVIKNFSYEVIGEKYKRLYEHTIRPSEGK